MDNGFKRGVTIAIIAYTWWGLSPLYWAFIDSIESFEILAYRIITSLIFMMIMIPILKKQKIFIQDVKYLLKYPMKLFYAILAGILIMANWGTFIWGVNNGFVLQSSLGYYIMPLISVVLGFIFLNERYKKMEWLAIIITLIGIIYMIVSIGEIPYVAFSLALTFGFYGLIKHEINIDSISSITIEVIVTIPIALIYIILKGVNNTYTVGFDSSTFWLMFAGIVTAVPLILFSKGVKYIPLSLISFLIYINPTLQFMLGVVVFNEPLESVHIITFIFIWIGMLIYSFSKYYNAKHAS